MSLRLTWHIKNWMMEKSHSIQLVNVLVWRKKSRKRKSLLVAHIVSTLLKFKAMKIKTELMDGLKFKLRKKSASFSTHRMEKKSTLHISKRYCTSLVCSILQAMDIKKSRTKGRDLTSFHRCELLRKRYLLRNCSRWLCRLQVHSQTLKELQMASASKRKNSSKYQEWMQAYGCPPQTDASTFDLRVHIGQQAVTKTHCLVFCWDF